MANTKISSLSSGNPAQSGDLIPIARSGSNFSITPASIVALAPATAWSGLGNASANLTLANGTNTTTFNQTSAVAWLWANTTAATSGTAQSSPLLEIAGQYWTGAASAADTWTVQNVIANGTNGQGVLTWAHSGSTNATISIPQGSVTNPGLGFSGLNVGLYGAAGVIYATDRSNSYVGLNLASSGVNSGIRVLSTACVGWSSSGTTVAGNATDTALQRTAAGVVAVGNGTVGNTSGQLTLTTIQMAASASAPTSAGTAGTAGQMIYNGTNFYICTVTGIAGSATWSKFNLTAV